MKILMIDNYDSFTYNLVQYLGELGASVETRRNDDIDIGEIEAMAPAGIVLSPGPCTPDQAGICLELVAAAGDRIPMLGVCLGHQVIGQVFGGRVSRAGALMHGKTSLVHHTGAGVFAGLPSPYTATRYHSLVVERDSVPDCLTVTAWTEDAAGEVEEVMGFRHRELPIEGVQFHPESILTEHGHRLLGNFLERLQ